MKKYIFRDSYSDMAVGSMQYERSNGRGKEKERGRKGEMEKGGWNCWRKRGEKVRVGGEGKGERVEEEVGGEEE